jgi:multidrug resistance efflux pump
MNQNGWPEYQRLVLSELKKHGEKLEKVSEQLVAQGQELAQLKVKAGAWGAISAIVVSIGAYIMSHVKI